MDQTQVEGIKYRGSSIGGTAVVLIRVCNDRHAKVCIYVGEIEVRVTPAALVARHEPETLQD